MFVLSNAFTLTMTTLCWLSYDLCFSTFLLPSLGPPPMNGTNEQLSSAFIFEHVDRMSRGADASRRLPNKVQLIAMQPMPVPPLHSAPINGKLSDTSQINKEVVFFFSLNMKDNLLIWRGWFLWILLEHDGTDQTNATTLELGQKKLYWLQRWIITQRTVMCSCYFFFYFVRKSIKQSFGSKQYTKRIIYPINPLINICLFVRYRGIKDYFISVIQKT